MWYLIVFGIYGNQLEHRLEALEDQQAQIEQAQHAAEHRRMLYDLWGIETGPARTPIVLRPGPHDSATEFGAWDR